MSNRIGESHACPGERTARSLAAHARGWTGNGRFATWPGRARRALTCCLAAQILCIAAPVPAITAPPRQGLATTSAGNNGTADGATAVGKVAPPRAAAKLDPLAAPPATLAQPAPALPPEQRRLLGIRTPTTANPGTLLSGGRRQALTFADLGARNPLQLHGLEGQNGVSFSVRNDEVVTAAVLHLVYSYSPALLPELSQLKVLVNGEVAATLPLPRAQAGMMVTRDVSIDPRFIDEYNHLNLQLIGHYTRSCEDPAHTSLWATISNASVLDLTYAALPPKPDLSALPQPFFDHRDVRRLELPFVFATSPDTGTAEAAGIIASWFGSLAGYRGAIFPAQLGSLPPSGNAIVLARQDDQLPGITLPPLSGPTLTVIPRPAPARGEILMVLGRNSDELKTAARALTLGQNTLSGTSATVDRMAAFKPRTPYDAPNWLPTSRPVRFGEWTDEHTLSVTGYDAPPIEVGLRVPPDLFMWNTKGAPLDLRYHYTIRPHSDRSSLNININDTFVRGFPIPAIHAPGFTLARFLGASGPENTDVARQTVYLPPQMLTPRAQLRLQYFYDIPDTGECAGRLLQNVQGTIDPDSTIDLTGFPHYMALPDLAAFANSGFPFARMADLSETAVILPDHPTPADYSLFLLAMGRMGASTGYPVTGVTVADAARVDRLADKDLLILGGPGNQPLLQRWAQFMPFSGDGAASRFALSDVMFRLANGWHDPQGTKRIPAHASLSLASNGTHALIAGFESPLRTTRSAVALISVPGRSESDLNAALLDADVLPSIQGALDIVRDRTVTVVEDARTYYVGTLPPLLYMRWLLSSHPLLLVLAGVLAALVTAALCFRALRAVAARRLKD
ncbi:cellulose biosynthesis cyclic di-GMP-binding regulatory protein BcsB [Burkholderia sp. Bp9126]|nr:cellulose biosynthesis cyclic di-GMP-binding regulatory protein BcsB [Burkholderia sp. Bp9126]